MSLESNIDAFFKSVFSVFINMSNPNRKNSEENLRKLIPKADSIMSLFKSRVEALEIGSNDEKSYSLDDRFNSFKATRLDSLDKFYSRTFLQLSNSAEITLNNIDNLRTEFERVEGNTKKHIEILLSTQRTKCKLLLQAKHLEHVQSMSNLRESIEKAKLSASDRIENEIKRISEHFEKQVVAKQETLNMTENASNKASVELKEMTNKRNKEMAEVQKEHNQIIQRHQSSVDHQLSEDEGYVKHLMEKYSKMKRSHLELGPAMQAMWEEIKSRNEKSFANTDLLIVLDLEEKLQMISKMKQQINEIEKECLKISGAHAKEYVGQKDCYEVKYNNTINNRESDIKNAIKNEMEKLDIRLHKMEQNLEKLLSNIECSPCLFPPIPVVYSK